jgi:hypothetical protein
VALDGSASSDDVGIAAYAWDCTDDGSAEANSASPTGSSCTYPDDGGFTLRLTVTDVDDASGSATAAVTIANAPLPLGSVKEQLPAVLRPSPFSVGRLYFVEP